MSNFAYQGARIIHQTEQSISVGAILKMTETYCIYTEDTTLLEKSALWKNVRFENPNYDIGEWICVKNSRLKGIIATLSTNLCVFTNDETKEQFTVNRTDIYKPVFYASAFNEMV